MDLLNANNTFIQDQLFYYSSQEVDRDVSSIYYDCTNFYAEIECEDEEREGMPEEWYEDHTLRKYGKSTPLFRWDCSWTATACPWDSA